MPQATSDSSAAAAAPQPQELPTTLMLSIGEEDTALREEACCLRCLGVALQDGCRCRHFIAFLFLSLVSICVLVFMNAANAFLLSTRYNVPVDQLGSITSELGVADEVWNIIMLGVWGVASDKIGRARVVVLGLVQVSAALFLFPLGTAVSPGNGLAPAVPWLARLTDELAPAVLAPAVCLLVSWYCACASLARPLAHRSIRRCYSSGCSLRRAPQRSQAC
jgi:hypothetical protein